MAVYLTKKAKAEMRRRRRKKEKAADEDSAPNNNNNIISKENNSQNGKKRSADQITTSSEKNNNGAKNDTPIVTQSGNIGNDHNGNGSSNKKAKLDNNKNKHHPQSHTNTIIVIPSDLSSKEAKKFRKDERRKARAQGIPDDKLTFLTKEQQQKQQQQQKGDNNNNNNNNNKNNKPKKSFPRIKDLLTQHAHQLKLQEQLTKTKSINDAIPPSEKSKYIAIDCEMVGVGTDGVKSALARASVVDWEGNILLDTFVRVPERVTDFRTHVSGVRPKDIAVRNEDAMDHEEVRNKVGMLLMDKILVGHALKNDLTALMISHPRHDIRDTAKYKPFMRATGRSGGKLRPRKLRDLVFEHLGKRIQVEGESHCSVDDARASMELFKCVRNRWEKELEKGGSGGKKGKK